jgi:quinolinate synthase
MLVLTTSSVHCRLQFVLGTESGMVTSIVRKVRALIAASGRRDVAVEIVFPVSSDAITTSGQTDAAGAPPTLPGGLAVVPGAAKGAPPLPPPLTLSCMTARPRSSDEHALAVLEHTLTSHLLSGCHLLCLTGEGCSAEGGCASCPYMKMNSLTALRSVCDRVGTPAGEAMLEAYKPRAYLETVGGRTMAQVSQAHFQRLSFLASL